MSNHQFHFSVAMPIESEIKLTERDDKSSVKPKKDTNPKRKSKIFINYCEDFFVNQPEELPDHNRFMPKIRKQIIDSLKNTQESAQVCNQPTTTPKTIFNQPSS